MYKLTAEEIANALTKLPSWELRNAKLHREFRFADFIHAFGFMSTAAIAIEKANHHPEWTNVWNRVTVDLTTHDAGGVTQKDIDLAHMLDGFARKLG